MLRSYSRGRFSRECGHQCKRQKKETRRTDHSGGFLSNLVGAKQSSELGQFAGRRLANQRPMGGSGLARSLRDIVTVDDRRACGLVELEHPHSAVLKYGALTCPGPLSRNNIILRTQAALPQETRRFVVLHLWVHLSGSCLGSPNSR